MPKTKEEIQKQTWRTDPRRERQKPRDKTGSLDRSKQRPWRERFKGETETPKWQRVQERETKTQEEGKVGFQGETQRKEGAGRETGERGTKT